MRLARLLTPIALAGVILAGCGDKTPDNVGTASPTAAADNGVAALDGKEILSKASAALKTAGSYRVKGDITTDGAKLALDIKIKGKDLMGTIGTPDGTIELLQIGDVVYFKAGESFWKEFGGEEGSLVASLLKGKWLKTTKDNKEFAEFTQLTDVEKLLESSGSVTKGDAATINGSAAIGLKDSSGEGTVYVATTGEPYPLRLEGPTGEGQLDFSDFGATFDEVKAPNADEVLDLDALMVP